MNQLTKIAFAEFLLPDVESGSKMVTIRQGRRNYADVVEVTDPDGNTQPYKLKITKVQHFVLEDVPAKAVEKDGFLDYTELVEGLQQFYPDLTEQDECTVVWFEKV